MATFKQLKALPVTTNQPLYNPATAEQFLPGQIVPGADITSLLTAGGVAQSAGLTPGFAPKIGHITTSAAQSKRRKTNPLAAQPASGLHKRNPFIVTQTPNADLFGLNIPV